MLAKTARGLFWMFRYLERCENTARLVETGFRISMTRSNEANDEWASIISTAGVRDDYQNLHDGYDAESIIDFLLRDIRNPSSVLSMFGSARDNARLVRAALTREVWEATNNCWMSFSKILANPVSERELPDVLDAIRKQTAQVRGTLHGTMLRNDIFNFAQLGTFLERADNTARILDVKYYVLLPSASYVGSSLDNVQWETILRSVSGMRAYNWINRGNTNPVGIADFLIMDRRMPRSLAYSYSMIDTNLDYLEKDYGISLDSYTMADDICSRFFDQTISSVFDTGLHEFLKAFIDHNGRLGQQIEQDFRFYG